MTGLGVSAHHPFASPMVVLGGTFNPIHAAHLALVRGAMTALKAQFGVFVVDKTAHHRDSVAPFVERRRMVRMALADEASMWEATDILLPASLIEAVNRLVDAGHEVHAVFGTDAARKLERWNGSQLLARARLWVVPRSGDIGGVPEGIGLLPIPVPPWSATAIRLAAATGAPTPSGIPVICRTHVHRIYGASNTGPASAWNDP